MSDIANASAAVIAIGAASLAPGSDSLSSSPKAMNRPNAISGCDEYLMLIRFTTDATTRTEVMPSRMSRAVSIDCQASQRCETGRTATSPSR